MASRVEQRSRWVGAAALALALAAGTAGGQEPRNAALADALQELVAAEYALDSAVADFRSASAAGELGPQERRDFEGFLQSLQQSVHNACERVSDLGGSLAGHQAYCSRAQATAPFSVPGTGRTEREQVAAIDARLDSSLAKFDELLMREQLELEASATRTGANARGGSAGGGGGGGSSGGRQGAQGQQGQQGPQGAQGQDGAQGQGGFAPQPAMPGQPGQQGQAGQPGQQSQGAGQGQQQGSQQAQASQAGGTGVRGGGVSPGSGGSVGVPGGPDGSAGPAGEGGNVPLPPPDMPSAQDDDIVARQLREAAENETDPELKRRLWEEYRRYKASQGG